MGLINRLIAYFWSNDVNPNSQESVNPCDLDSLNRRIGRIERMAYRKKAKGETLELEDNHSEDEVTVNDILGGR